MRKKWAWETVEQEECVLKRILLLPTAHPSCHLEICNDGGKHSLLLHATSKMLDSETCWILSFIILQQRVLYLGKECIIYKT